MWAKVKANMSGMELVQLLCSDYGVLSKVAFLGPLPLGLSAASMMRLDFVFWSFFFFCLRKVATIGLLP